MNILILPKRNISFHHLWKESGFPILDARSWKEFFSFKLVAYEWLYYADLTKVNNHGETFIVGNLHDEYLKPPPVNTTNPAAHLSPKYKSISVKSAFKNKKNFDILVCSIEAVIDKHPIYLDYLKAGITIIIIDHPDHESIYETQDLDSLTYGLKHKKDFNFYFKKDLPLGWSNIPGIYPLAPDPIRLECFPEVNSKTNFTNSFFFSGILNKPVTKENRESLLNVFNGSKHAKLNVIDVKDHYGKNLPLTNNEMSLSKFILSPAGRSWTTTRHTMTAAAKSCPILPSPDCEIVGPAIEDMEHAILYPMLRYLDSNQSKQEAEALFSKVDAVDELTRNRIANNWYNFVKEHHTTEARAKYILKVASE